MKRTSLSMAAVLLLTGCSVASASGPAPVSAPTVTAAAEAPGPQVTLEPLPAPSPEPVPVVEVAPVPSPEPVPVVEVGPAPVVPAPPAPASVVEEAPQPVPVVEVAPAPAPPAPAPSGMDWINATMAQYGAYPPAGTAVSIGECPPYDACVQGWGTAAQHLVFSPRVIGDVGLLLHEIAHTQGIDGECAADAWASARAGFQVRSASAPC